MKKTLMGILTVLTLISYESAFGQKVRVSAVGQWTQNYRAPSGVQYGWFWDAHVWMDLVVSPLNYGKSVGVIWTTDNWETVHEAEGKFDGPAGDGYELWSVDFKAAEMKSCFWCENEEKLLEYAVYSKLGELQFWDNNNGANYRLVIDPEYKGQN